MADDIVIRLRDHEHCDPECVTMKAADEIERLREEVRKVRLDHITTLGELQEAAAENELLREQVRWASNRASEWKLETYQLNTEIERLRAQEQDLRMYAEQDACEIERLRAEVGRLRNSVDTLTNMLSEQCDMSDRYALAANKAEAEIERLRAVVLEWDASTDCFWDDVDSYDAAVQRYRAARAAAVKEARRG